MEISDDTVRLKHAAEIAERLAVAGGRFAHYGKPNTVFIPSRGSPPVPYYSPQRPTRGLRLLCWLIGARVDYLPDRVGFPRPPRVPRGWTPPPPRPPEPTNESIKE